MKISRQMLTLFVLLMAIIINFASQTAAYDKKSVVERFTNASCGPCATINNAWYNANTASMINSESISHIIYNVWWPGAGDPMYLLNLADNTARTNYYGVNSVPDIFVNGTDIGNTQTGLTNAVNAGNSEYSPFNIEIIQGGYSETLIEATVKITRDPSDNTIFGNDVRLQFGITEKRVVFSNPPGSNGESEFFSVCRKMLPDANGSVITIPAPGDFTEITLQYIPTAAFLQAVDLDSVRFVAFIQDHNTKETYQSVMQEVIQNYVAEILQTSPDVVGDNATNAEFTTVINNIGLMSDMYYINTSLDGPTGWTGEYTTSNGTHSLDEIDSLEVDPGGSATISVTVSPNNVDGFGKTTVGFSSKNNPGFVGSTLLRNVTTTGVEILVVDASQEDFGAVVSNSLDNISITSYGVVSSSAINSTVDLSNFVILSWSAGIALPVFNQEKVTALQNYLDGGGSLFINGQDIGSDIFEPGGQSQFAQSFYNNYLHASYEANSGSAFLLKGYDGDPISDGLLFIISDIYDRSADVISPFDADATPIFDFLNTTEVSSIRVSTATNRVVYLGIGFEQIDNAAAAQDSILARSIRWLTPAVGVSNDLQKPLSYSLNQNYPNPFNPATRITYSVREEGPVNIKVFDMIGQEIITLVDEVKKAGTYSINFKALNLSSGVYIYQMRAGDFISAKKMSILK
jgi:hypothetical protein